MSVTIHLPPWWKKHLPWNVGYYAPAPNPSPRLGSLEIPGDLTGWTSLSLGTKMRTLGDALMQSTLPEKLKSKYPNLKIYLFQRAMNPVVFANNPAIDGKCYFPKRLYADDCDWGQGHHIQLKESYFGLPIASPPKGRIFLTEKEKAWAKDWIQKQGLNPEKSITLLHPWGGTWPKVAALELWSNLVSRFRGKTQFVQIGVVGHTEVPGVQASLLTEKDPWEARKLFALFERSKIFVGVNSGPMHVARVFDVPSLIVTQQGSLQGIFEKRRRLPYYQGMNIYGAFLYEENQHLEVDLLSPQKALEAASQFLEKWTEKG
jgi:ADP-heptose:LPS heptosyltransferase